MSAQHYNEHLMYPNSLDAIRMKKLFESGFSFENSQIG